MNTIHTALAKVAAIAVLASFSGMAAAGGTQTVNASATVLKVCTFTAGAALALTFADIDPSGTGDKTKTLDVPYKCTKGSTPTSITVTAGGTELKNGGESMPYSIGLSAASPGNGFNGAAVNVVVTGTIPDTSYRDAKALTYIDTVTLTIVD